MSTIYLSIAIDVAAIVNDEFAVGSRLSGNAAGQWRATQQSSETIRKAIMLLRDANVVSVSQRGNYGNLCGRSLPVHRASQKHADLFIL